MYTEMAKVIDLDSDQEVIRSYRCDTKEMPGGRTRQVTEPVFYPSLVECMLIDMRTHMAEADKYKEFEDYLERNGRLD